MAKVLLLSILVAIAVAEVAAAPMQLSPKTKKAFDELRVDLSKVVDVVVAAAPPAQQAEVRRAALMHLQTANDALEKAKETGDEKKFTNLILLLELATMLVTKAPPSEKLKVMEDSFKPTLAPNPTPATQLSPAAKKAINELRVELFKIVDVVVAAAPPAQQAEVKRAALTHLRTANGALEKAKETGDEKKFSSIILSLEIAALLVNKAPPAEKLKVMEESFNSAVAPSPTDCPSDTNKSYCKMHDKVQKAYIEVVEAAAPGKKLEVQEEVIKKTIRTSVLTINKAYAGGNEKKIAGVLAAYEKAADAVIVAAPAEKLKVMQETFAATDKAWV
ncbi:unnamed protein product [Urochloa humidicola]